MSPTLQADSLPAEPPGEPKKTEVGSLSLLQRIFPTQELNQSLLHSLQADSLPSELWEDPSVVEVSPVNLYDLVMLNLFPIF